MGNRQVLEQARDAYACTQPITLHRNLREDRLIGSVFAGMLFGRGIATTFPYEAGAFLKTRPDLLAPDIQVHFMPALEHAANLYFPKSFGKPPLEETHGFSLRVGPTNPESSGWFALRSADRADAPLIQPNHLQSEADCWTTIAGIQKNGSRGYRATGLRRPPCDAGHAARIDTLDGQLRDAVGHPQHAARVDAAKIRLHQEVRKYRCVVIGHAAGSEDCRHLSQQPACLDSPLALRAGVSRHSDASWRMDTSRRNAPQISSRSSDKGFRSATLNRPS